jgi:hypothetical protein
MIFVNPIAESGLTNLNCGLPKRKLRGFVAPPAGARATRTTLQETGIPSFEAGRLAPSLSRIP